MSEIDLIVESVSLEYAAQLFKESSAENISVETIQADIAAGAPLNDDGTLNIVSYAAWLLQNRSTPKLS